MQLQERLRKVVVGGRKAGIDLNGIAELDGGFQVLAVVVVALPALVILLLAHVGVARTSQGKKSDNSQYHHEPNHGKMLHGLSAGLHSVLAWDIGIEKWNHIAGELEQPWLRLLRGFIFRQ